MTRRTVFAAILMILIFSLVAASCSSKFTENGGMKSSGSEGAETTLAVPPQEINTEVTDPGDTPPVETPVPNPVTSEAAEQWAAPDLTGLKQFLAPCFTEGSVLFLEKDADSVFNQYIFNNDYLDTLIPSEHWEALIRAAFYFRDDAESNQMVKMYLSDFGSDGFIPREAATAGLMKLLSLRYPIGLGGDAESFKPSEAVQDLKQCESRFEYLVRQAYCEGLTDTTVGRSLTFRPKDFLTYAEGISMVYKVLSKYGLYDPVSGKEDSNAVSAETGGAATEPDREEFDAYLQTLDANRDLNAGKLACLKAAETIITEDGAAELNAPMEMRLWKAVLSKALGLDFNDVTAYTSLDGSDVLAWDTAAVSIFKLGYKINAFEIRDATADEMTSARTAIPNFDLAMDASKFAQMYASGLLNGFCESPEFSPDGIMTRGDALVIVKRIVEHMP